MAFCKNCGAELAEDQKFCANCGATVEEAPAETAEVAEVAEPVVAEAPKKAGLNVGMLVWSIIGIVCCCAPLSIAGLIFTILASTNTPAEAEIKLQRAKLFNILSIVAGVIMYICSFIMGFIGGLLESAAIMM